MSCWRSFAQSLARIRQGRPDVTEELAWRELRVEIDLTLWGMSEGVPIDKFRYPWRGKMVDLVVLVRNKHLAYEDIRWQGIECNLEWLERRWPLPPIPKLSGKEWILSAYTRRASTLRLMTITEAARTLAEESEISPDCAGRLSKGYIKNELRKLKVWKPQPRHLLNRPQQRRK